MDFGDLNTDLFEVGTRSDDTDFKAHEECDKSKDYIKEVSECIAYILVHKGGRQ